MIHQQAKNLVATMRAVKPWQWVAAVIVAIAAVVLVSSMAEFIVALQNRYSVYPAGYDTSMLAKSIGMTGVFSLAAAYMVAHILRITLTRWYVTVFLLLLASLMCLSDTSWLTAFFALPIFIANIAMSFRTKLFFLVPVLAFIIMFLAGPSFIPANWCAQELTIYSCAVY